MKRKILIVMAVMLLMSSFGLNYQEVYAENNGSGDWKKAYIDFFENYNYEEFEFPNFMFDIDSKDLDNYETNSSINFFPMILNFTDNPIPELVLGYTSGTVGSSNMWTSLNFYGYRDGKVVPLENNELGIGNGAIYDIVKGKNGKKDKILVSGPIHDDYGNYNYADYEVTAKNDRIVRKKISDYMDSDIGWGDIDENYKEADASRKIKLYKAEYPLNSDVDMMFTMNMDLARAIIRDAKAIEPVKLILDGKTLPVSPIIQNSRAMVPIRIISEEMGKDVAWDPSSRKVTVSSLEDKIVLTIDSKKAYVNGEEILLDAAPKISNSTTFVPLRFIASALGKDVEWVSDTKTVIIK